nr:pyridoxamine 5'-phosphate oxidase family protein [Rhodoferax sp.]
MDHQHDQDSTKQLWSLIEGMRFAMLTTHARSDHLHARPMTMQNKNFDDGKLWFFMSRSGDTVGELQSSPNVGVAFVDPGDDKYVSLSAVARVVEDRSKVRELWSKMDDAWFKGGTDDPDLALVEVSVVHGHYWDVKESKLTQLFLMAKAAVTDERPHIGESGEVAA